MACVAYKTINFRSGTQDRIAVCNEIISSYRVRGLQMTLRQLYYQLVGRNLIANEEREYKRLSVTLSDARLAGLIDWDNIEDRNRRPVFPTEFRDLEHRVAVALDNYRLDRWAGQDYYAELWCEKRALENILEPIAHDHHAVYMTNVGYSSTSAMRSCAERFISASEAGQVPVLFYIGDHDPSGEDMVRDIRDRLALFRADVDVRKLALSIEQVEAFKLPPNPAKKDDKRSDKYIAKHGDSSWEVDALPPDALIDSVTAAFDSVIDQEALMRVLQREEDDKDKLRAALSGIGDVA